MITARMKFIKGEEVKYISHLDLQKAFQRALRRGEVDVAYSQGFNPHPKISFAMALAVGMTSEGEYVDVELNAWIKAEELIETINQVLPKGLLIIDCKVSDKSNPALMSTIRKSIYQIKLTTKEEFDKEQIERKIINFLEQKEIIIEKTNKKGNLIEKDMKPLIDEIIVDKVEGRVIYFEMKLAAGSQNNVKPEMVVEKLSEFEEPPLAFETMKVHRIELLTQEGKQLVNPLKIFS